MIPVEVRYEVHISRDGSWWVVGTGRTNDRAHENAKNAEGYHTLPRRTIKFTTETRVEIIEEGDGEERDV